MNPRGILRYSVIEVLLQNIAVLSQAVVVVDDKMRFAVIGVMYGTPCICRPRGDAQAVGLEARPGLQIVFRIEKTQADLRYPQGKQDGQKNQ